MQQEQNRRLLFVLVKKSAIEYLVLFKNKKFNINFKDKSGKTLLHYACIQGDFEIVKLLIEMDIDFSIKDKSNKSCIQYAEKYEFYDIVDYINDFYDCSYSNEDLYDDYDDALY